MFFLLQFRTALFVWLRSLVRKPLNKHQFNGAKNTSQLRLHIFFSLIITYINGPSLTMNSTVTKTNIHNDFARYVILSVACAVIRRWSAIERYSPSTRYFHETINHKQSSCGRQSTWATWREARARTSTLCHSLPFDIFIQHIFCFLSCSCDAISAFFALEYCSKRVRNGLM